MDQANFTDTLWGGELIVTFFVFFLYGINLSQGYTYWLNRKRDSPALRWTVLLVLIIDTAHTSALMHGTYTPIIKQACDLPRQLTITPSAGVCAVLGVLLTAIVQVFFVRRIWILSNHNNLLTSIPAICVIFRFGSGLASNSFTFIMKTWTQYRERTGPLIALGCGFGSSALTDVLIAAISILLLRRSQTGFKETDHLVEKLMLYVVHTGAITAVCSIGVILLFVLEKQSLAFGGMIFLTSKLYASCFLATLNARQSLGNRMVFNPSQRTDNHLQHQLRPPVIEIFQETSKTTDVEEFPMSRVSESNDLRQKVAHLV